METQDIEGVNSIIKTIWKRSPAIAWALMSSRMTLRKFIAAHLSSKESRDAFVAECVAHHKASVSNQTSLPLLLHDSRLGPTPLLLLRHFT
eukprot:2148254-Pyramimonas_sp.AAC.1